MRNLAPVEGARADQWLSFCSKPGPSYDNHRTCYAPTSGTLFAANGDVDAREASPELLDPALRAFLDVLAEAIVAAVLDDLVRGTIVSDRGQRS